MDSDYPLGIFKLFLCQTIQQNVCNSQISVYFKPKRIECKSRLMIQKKGKQCKYCETCFIRGGSNFHGFRVSTNPRIYETNEMDFINYNYRNSTDDNIFLTKKLYYYFFVIPNSRFKEPTKQSTKIGIHEFKSYHRITRRAH